MTFLNFLRDDFHKNHKMASSTIRRCSDTWKELTVQKGDRAASHPSLSVEAFVPPIHLIHCVLCGCAEDWVVMGEKSLEMHFRQQREGHWWTLMK